VSPKQGIPIEAIGPEPRFVPIAILLADERSILTRRQAEARQSHSAWRRRSASRNGFIFCPLASTSMVRSDEARLAIWNV